MEELSEIWKDVIDYEDHYQISSKGRIRSKDRCVIYKNGKTYFYKSKILKLLIDEYGYLRVNLNKNNKMQTKNIHRLVATHFIPNPDNLSQINHIDGVKENNTISNLEWCDAYHNLNHSYENNLKQIKLTKKDVQRIKEIYESGYYTQREIGEIYNVKKEHINGIINNKKRVHV